MRRAPVEPGIVRFADGNFLRRPPVKLVRKVNLTEFFSLRVQILTPVDEGTSFDGGKGVNSLAVAQQQKENGVKEEQRTKASSILSSIGKPAADASCSSLLT